VCDDRPRRYVRAMQPSVVRLNRSARLAPDVPYAYSATVPASANLVHLAGACPLDEHAQVVAPGDVAAQAQRCVDNLLVALADAGCRLADVVSTRVLVATVDRSDLTTAWDVVHDAFAGHEVPSTLLGVTVLGWPGQLVEIEAVAVAPAP
jgi:enamine deaminase RidA (YjgF/YER057c/UK114 family)